MEQPAPRRHLRLVERTEAAGLRASPPLGTLLGTAERLRGKEPVYLSFDHRRRGVYASGQPRTGKSTFLLNLAIDDFANGRPAFVIDPHGELVGEILRRLPVGSSEEEERVLVFDPAFVDRPIGIDLLDARDEFEEDRTVQFMIELVESLVPVAEQRGPILNQGIRNSMRLLFEAGGSLAELPEILTNRSFRSKKLEKAKDPLLRRYWESVWPSLERSNDGSAAAYFSSKFSQFLDDRALRNIFGQRRSRGQTQGGAGLDFDRAIDEANLVLLDLARGRLGNINSQLLGLVILHCIERAVMRLRPGKRAERDAAAKGVTVAIDECHEFQVEGLSRMITAFPKHNAALVLANQSVMDLPKSLRIAVMGSMETFVMLRQGRDAAMYLEDLLQPRFDERDLMRLPDYQALLRGQIGDGHKALRLSLAPPPRVVHDEETIARLRKGGAERLGQPRGEVEAEILSALLSKEDPPREPSTAASNDRVRDRSERCHTPSTA